MNEQNQLRAGLEAAGVRRNLEAIAASVGVPPPPAAPEVIVDKQAMAELERDAAKGREIRQKEERERLIAEAVAAGKFPKERAEIYRAAFRRDFDGTKALLARLEPYPPLPTVPGDPLTAAEREQLNRAMAAAGADLDAARRRGGLPTTKEER